MSEGELEALLFKVVGMCANIVETAVQRGAHPAVALRAAAFNLKVTKTQVDPVTSKFNISMDGKITVPVRVPQEEEAK